MILKKLLDWRYVKRIVDAPDAVNAESSSGWFDLIGGLLTIILTVEFYKIITGM